MRDIPLLEKYVQPLKSLRRILPVIRQSSRKNGWCDIRMASREDIPESKNLQVADIYDALTTPRLPGSPPPRKHCRFFQRSENGAQCRPCVEVLADRLYGEHFPWRRTMSGLLLRLAASKWNHFHLMSAPNAT